MANRRKTKRRSRNAPDRASDLNLEAALRALAREPAQKAVTTGLARPSSTLRIPSDPGETDDEAHARTAIRPTMRAATTIAAFDQSIGELDLTTLVGKLAEQVTAVQAGDLGRAEEMLIAQAHTLDLLFHQLVQRSVKNINAGYREAGETYMRLALRTQSQCRASLETLSVVKHPPAVAFVRQANIANGPQQVNNGSAPEPSRAREIPQPQLLEQQHVERLDTGTAQASGRSDPAMATVGKINGATHGGG